jgi:curli production assembly/transport component CsgG
MPLRFRPYRWVLIVPLFLGFLLSSGCGLLPTYPVTDGFHHSLPKKETRIVIWGISPTVTGTATTWLQKRGFRVVERAKLLQLFEEQRIRLTHTADDEGPILRVGKLLGAETVVSADASVTSGVVSNYSVDAYGGSGHSVPVNSAPVLIRGVDVETSEVLWSGIARYPKQSSGTVEDGLAKLTCQALATAWGFRPAGDEAISSQSMCAADKPLTSAAP